MEHLTSQGFSHPLRPVSLEGYGVRLDPMGLEHAADLERAVHDGDVWRIRIASAPAPEDTEKYIRDALRGQEVGTMLPFVVIDCASGKIIGSTRYHDIVPAIARLEIGGTWYGRSWQRTHVNTACKLLLMCHAFETLEARVVGWRTDRFNHVSQRAIERLGAHRDGVLRHHALRRDGTVRDTVMYSLLAGEWPEVKIQLEDRLDQGALEAGLRQGRSPSLG